MTNKPIEKRGMHNWRKLFRKPTSSDWIILLMLFFVMITIFLYKHDVEQCLIIVGELVERVEECESEEPGIEQEFDWDADWVIVNDTNHSHANPNNLSMDV